MEKEERRARRNAGAIVLVESQTRVLTPPRSTYSDDEDFIRNIFNDTGIKRDIPPKSNSPESGTTA